MRHASPGRGSQESRSAPRTWASSSGKEGGSLRALCYLRRSNECDPQDPQTEYALAFARDSIEPAQKHFQAVLEVEAPEELRGLARNGLRRWQPAHSRPGGQGRTALLSGWARRLFRGRALEVREITFEIGMLGHYGLDINDPRETHVLRALPGMDIGMDLGEDWGWRRG